MGFVETRREKGFKETKKRKKGLKKKKNGGKGFKKTTGNERKQKD